MTARRSALVRSRDKGRKLEEMGAVVDDVVAYRTVSGPEASRRGLMEAIKDPDAEAIVFASGSAVRGIVALAGAKAGAARAMRAVSSALAERRE